MSDINTREWAAQIRQEVEGNILPFWSQRVTDPAGGYFGFIDCDGVVQKDAPRGGVVNARILWSFSIASRLIDSKYGASARHSYAYLTRYFHDKENGGFYWMLDSKGDVISDRKQTYAQAFSLYAFAEYARMEKNDESLQHAIELFHLIEQHCYDPVRKGYIEAKTRDWKPMADMRLSDKDLNCPKSMNTHLHIMEAYTNLLRVWRDPQLIQQQTELIEITLDRIIDSANAHFKLFFDADWNSANDHVSYGHDIEGSWLLAEATEVLGNPELHKRARHIALEMAERTYQQGIDKDGSLFYEADGTGHLIDAKKHWWAQAEAMVGFYNAFQMCGDEKFLRASHAVWQYIRTKIVDQTHGEWYAKLTPDGTPLRFTEDPDAHLVGPWKCPYHNTRACVEMLTRLAGQPS